MSDQPETVTLHAVRITSRGGWRCIQFAPDEGWWVPELGDYYNNLAELEEAHGETREVRIVTTDPGSGRCGALTPRSVSQVSLACQLVAGHLGWHKSGTCEWAEPVEAAGLSAEQEIRARALDFAARFHDPPADTVLLAEQFAGWIRDGSVPDAG